MPVAALLDFLKKGLCAEEPSHQGTNKSRIDESSIDDLNESSMADLDELSLRQIENILSSQQNSSNCREGRVYKKCK